MAHNLELAPTAREDGCIQRFYQYLILSKPSWKLVLPFLSMASGRSGKAALRPDWRCAPVISGFEDSGKRTGFLANSIRTGRNETPDKRA